MLIQMTEKRRHWVPARVLKAISGHSLDADVNEKRVSKFQCAIGFHKSNSTEFRTRSYAHASTRTIAHV
jgi:hypothetical protein